MTFKEKLAILRKTKGLTQDGFAKAIGVSRQSVYKWESGVSYPEVPKLLEIKVLLGISLDDLFDESFELSLPEKKKRGAKKEVSEKLTLSASEEQEIKAEPVAEAATQEASAPAAEKTETEEERKVGFFGRLFGRK